MKYIQTLFVVFIFVSCQSPKEKLTDEIRKGEAKLYGDSVKTFDRPAAEAVFKNYITFADTYKDDSISAEYLFKAGDLSNGLGRSTEAISVFDRLRASYPNHPKSATALFMQGFIYETAVHDKDKAKEKYAEFIQKYPDHKLAPSAKASLDQINSNLSDEELIKMFEAKNGK